MFRVRCDTTGWALAMRVDPLLQYWLDWTDNPFRDTRIETLRYIIQEIGRQAIQDNEVDHGEFS